MIRKIVIGNVQVEVDEVTLYISQADRRDPIPTAISVDDAHDLLKSMQLLGFDLTQYPKIES